MSPFKALYGRKFRTLVIWDNPVNRNVHGLEMFKEMDQEIAKMRKKLKVDHDKKKYYADQNRMLKEFQVGNHVYLHVRTRKSFLKLGSSTKMAPRYCGSSEVLEMTGLVAYMLVFLANNKACDVFHVSLLKKYAHDHNHVIYWDAIKVEVEGDLQTKPLHTLDRNVTFLWNRAIR